MTTGSRFPGLPRASDLPRDGLTILVRGYQLVFRPVLGPNCRFHPSCSDYAIEALRRFGAVRGVGLASRRILRCNPWHPGGHDPVPDPCSCGSGRSARSITSGHSGRPITFARD